MIFLFAYQKNIKSEFVRPLLWFQEVKLCAWDSSKSDTCVNNCLFWVLIYQEIKNKKALVLISVGIKCILGG